ncbi:hypothetical protein GWK47_054864 [Chionoecetes opilio]|uniref:Reverse transcriptase n=1 Tax=Chionoecetes opilio TaxID=41210 RepID=A0A8J4XYM7_CHIOP|nr:hypothetical protein GWK47_054864 [Chionoecetes opilio]
MTDATNGQLGDITAWGRRWQVKFAAEKTQAMVISHSREDARLLEGKLKFGDIKDCAIKDSINILGVEVDSRLSFYRHLETVARRSSLRVTQLRRVRHLLDVDGLMRLYMAQVRPVMEYSPLTWMNSTQCHLSLLDKVQRRAECLIQPTDGQQCKEQWRDDPRFQLDSLGHRKRVGALTVLHKAQVQQSSHLAGLRVPWTRSERATRTVVSGDLLEAPRTHTATGQPSLTWATATLWNAFTAEVDVVALNTQQVMVAAHRWCRTHPL